ncbi:SatD family protein [Candidatus Pyrohabitans sp.]
MRERLYVVLGDVVSSRRLVDRAEFQNKLEKTCKEINKTYAEDIYADFKILKGTDEIAGVLSDLSNIYKIISTIQEQLYPNYMRFAVVLDRIDTALETKDAALMDGPAFHKASDIMNKLKKSKLMFDMSVSDKIVDTAISGQINLILLLKKNWSPKQRQIVGEYEKTKNQSKIAKKLGITQQAVSKILGRSMWKEIKTIEGKLNQILRSYSQKQHIGWMSND